MARHAVSERRLRARRAPRSRRSCRRLVVAHLLQRRLARLVRSPANRGRLRCNHAWCQSCAVKLPRWAASRRSRPQRSHRHVEEHTWPDAACQRGPALLGDDVAQRGENAAGSGGPRRGLHRQRSHSGCGGRHQRRGLPHARGLQPRLSNVLCGVARVSYGPMHGELFACPKRVRTNGLVMAAAAPPATPPASSCSSNPCAKYPSRERPRIARGGGTWFHTCGSRASAHLLVCRVQQVRSH